MNRVETTFSMESKSWSPISEDLETLETHVELFPQARGTPGFASSAQVSGGDKECVALAGRF